MRQNDLAGPRVSACTGPLANVPELLKACWQGRVRRGPISSEVFAYLWRRFGPPQGVGDAAVDLCHYRLGTPEPDVRLWLSPRLESLVCGLLAPQSFQDEAVAPSRAWWAAYDARMAEPPLPWTEYAQLERHQSALAELGPRPESGRSSRVKAAQGVRVRVEDALKATLAELSRPVPLGERWLTLFGPLDCVPPWVRAAPAYSPQE